MSDPARDLAEDRRLAAEQGIALCVRCGERPASGKSWCDHCRGLFPGSYPCSVCGQGRGPGEHAPDCPAGRLQAVRLSERMSNVRATVHAMRMRHKPTI